ncbi:MAG: N-acetylmuramoyl-L-alanine amidase [Pleurocapsa sp.]
MKYFLGLVALTAIFILGSIAVSAQTEFPTSLFLAYPPPQHETTAEKIFFIGTAPPTGKVTVNGKSVDRSHDGHFAPSFPLKIGENSLTIRHQDEKLELTVIRNSTEPEIPDGVAFAPNSLTPAVDVGILPDELICFGAVAPPDAQVAVRIGSSKILLLPQIDTVELPPNSAVLTAQTEPVTKSNGSQYEGCTVLEEMENYGKPIFELKLDGEVIREQGKGEINILSPKDVEVVEVIADTGVARTGAGTDYSRLTPLPQGTKARVTGKQGEWLRLDYGGWIKKSETQAVPNNIPAQSLIRGITSRQVPGATEIIFPLQLPVPVKVQQGNNRFTLSLYNTTAQTDTIRLDPDPLIKRLDWQQVSPTQIDYDFQLWHQQQWGYDLRYKGTSLILSLRHPPAGMSDRNIASLLPLQGIKILLDPGHGGEESGSKGPTGYTEKEINLVISRLVETELKRLGATVYLTREKDEFVSLEDRVKAINKIQPDLAISIHYNALPDSGDAINTKGIGTFWYHPQAQDIAVFLHSYLVGKLNRPSYGTFWNNLALTRPHTAPSILLELGFMINPEEFEWITDKSEQPKLANAIAQGIKEWFDRLRRL